MNQEPLQEEDKNWERIRTVLFQKPALKGSEAFVTRVMARLDAMPAKTRWSWAFPRWALAGVGALALGGLLLLPFIRSPKPSRLPQETIQVASLNEWDLLEPNNDQETFGTTIEEYFL